MRKYFNWLKQLAQGRTLASQILLYFFVAAFIASIGVGSFTYVTARHRINKQLTVRFNDDASLMTTYIAQTIAAAYFDIQLLSYNSVITSQTTSISEKLVEMDKTQWLHGLFEDITLLNSEGAPLVSTGDTSVIDWAAVGGVYSKVLKGSLSPYISDVQNQSGSGHMVVIIGAPVFDYGISEDWTVSSIVVAQMSMEQIWRFSDSMKIGKTGYVAIIDSSNRYIAHPDKGMLSQYIATDPVSVAQGKLFNYKETASNEKRTGLIGQTISNPSWVDKGWRVVISQESDEAYHFLQQTLWLILVVLALAIMFFMVVGLLVSRRLSKPLHVLADGTKHIAVGDFSHRVDINRRDEIGDLAQAYNEMAIKLEQRESDRRSLLFYKKAVTRWSSVSGTLSVEKYLYNLAEAILDASILDTFGCFSVWVLLAREQKLESKVFLSLRPEATVALAKALGQDINRASFDLGTDDNLFTQVCNTVRPIFVKGQFPTGQDIVDSLLLGEYGGVAALPLYTGDKNRGVLVVVQDKPFTQGQSGDLLALAMYSSVALENAFLYEATREQSEEKSRLYELVGLMSSSLEFREVLERALDGIMSLVPSPEQTWAIISSYDEKSGTFIYEAGRGTSDLHYDKFNFQLNDASSRWLSPLLTGNVMMFRDVDLLSKDQDSPNYLHKVMHDSGMKSWLLIPLMVRRRLIGTLRICNRLPVLPSEQQLEALRNLANNIAIALDNARLYETAQAQSLEKSRLYELAGLMSSSLEFREVLERALDGIMSLVPSPETSWAIISSFNEQENRFASEASRGISERVFKGYKYQLDEVSAKWVAPISEGKVLMVSDINTLSEQYNFPDFFAKFMKRAGMKSWLIIPLMVKGQLIGTLWVSNMLPVLPNDIQLDALHNLANNIAVAMENAGLYDRERHRASELQNLEQLKTDFMLAISHELKTPLTSLSVSAGLLQEEIKTAPGTPVNRLLNGMVNSVERLTRLVTDLLEAARLESSTLELNWELADIVSTVKAAAIPFSPLMETKKQIFILDVPPNGLWAFVDLQRLEQIVTNLLSNAYKFTPAGGDIRIVLKEEGKNFVLIVSDTGPGIPEEEQQRIFEPFYRARGAPRHTGTGLGLTIARRLVELHGGSINVSSQVGHGTTFTILIPKGVDKQENDNSGNK